MSMKTPLLFKEANELGSYKIDLMMNFFKTLRQKDTIFVHRFVDSFIRSLR